MSTSHKSQSGVRSGAHKFPWLFRATPTADIQYLRTVLPSTTEEEFFQYLQELDTREVIMYAVPEGSVVFPKVPVLRLEGPLPIVQLLETTLLTLVNYARYQGVRGQGQSAGNGDI